MRAAVVGGSGFVGSHVVRTLCSKGWSVRATTRDPAKAGWLKQLGDVELCEVSLSPAGPAAPLDALVAGCDAVFFCAGFEQQEPATVDFMVNNALAALHAAQRNRVGVVVLTSSGGSTNPPGHSNAVPKNELEHWSDPEFQKANGRWSPAAKTLMELACLKAVGRNARNEVVEAPEGFVPRLCIMNPNLILGPQLQPGPPSGNSLPWVRSILRGETMKAIPNDSMSVVDVRDLAALHVACAEQANASGRYFGVDRSYAWEDLLASFKRAYPAYELPPRFEGEGALPTQFDTARRDSLGVQLRPLDDVLQDLIAFMLERGVL